MILKQLMMLSFKLSEPASLALEIVNRYLLPLLKSLSFEDASGLYDTVFFPKVYNQFCHMLNEMRPYILKGKVEEDFGSITLTVSWIGFSDRYNRAASRPHKEDVKVMHGAQ